MHPIDPVRNRAVGARFSRAVARLCVALSVAVGVLACSMGDVASPARPAPDEVTTFRQVQPILAAHCQSCHRDGQIAPFPLVTYEDARLRAAAIASVTRSGEMPPWTARTSPDCTPPAPWRNDERLSEADIAALAAWSEGGAVEGDLDDVAPTIAPSNDGLGRVDRDLGSSEPFAAAGAEDQFICFLLDPKLDEERFARGLRVVPGNRKVVHHVTVSIANAEEVAKIVESGRRAGSVEPTTGGPGFPCGDATLGRNLQVWTPGGTRVDLPDGVGIRLEKGSLIVLGVHYSNAHDGALPDATRVQIQFADERPRFEMIAGSIGGAGRVQDGLVSPNGNADYTFLVPANASHHVEQMRFVTQTKAAVYGVMAHMHLSGVDMKIDVSRKAPDGSSVDICLLQDKWNFHWQRTYVFGAPIDALPTFEPGDVITLTCTYDNSVHNPQLLHYLAERGEGPLEGIRDRRLGPRVEQEMCNFYPQFIVPLK